MSSTNRGAKRNDADNYPTPTWCVGRFLEAVDLPGGNWMEPSAGEGALIAAVQSIRSDVTWTANELRNACAGRLQDLLYPSERVSIGSFLDLQPDPRHTPDVVISNPPFSLAMDFINHALSFQASVVMLLRLNFFGTLGRAEFLQGHTPDVYVLPDRPSFTGKGTDSIEYAWFVWPGPGERRQGTIKMLATTPSQEKKSDPVKGLQAAARLT